MRGPPRRNHKSHRRGWIIPSVLQKRTLLCFRSQKLQAAARTSLHPPKNSRRSIARSLRRCGISMSLELSRRRMGTSIRSLFRWWTRAVSRRRPAQNRQMFASLRAKGTLHRGHERTICCCAAAGAEGRKMNRRRIVGAIPILSVIVGSAALPAPWAQSGASSVPQTPAPVRFALGGNAAEIPAKFIGNLIFPPARINNDKPSWFFLDSTAAVSSVSPSRIAELGLTTLENPVLNLPGVDFPFAGLPALEKENFAAQTGRSYQGTLGNDFLRPVVVEI